MDDKKFVWSKEEKKPFVGRIVLFSVLLGVCCVMAYVGMILLYSGSLFYYADLITTTSSNIYTIIGVILLLMGSGGIPGFIVGIVKSCNKMKAAKKEAREHFENSQIQDDVTTTADVDATQDTAILADSVDIGLVEIFEEINDNN